MKDNFSLRLSEAFKQTIANAYGALGVAWLASLDTLLVGVMQRFSLTEIELMDDLSYNLVAKVESKIYGSCVLKLSVDYEALKREVEALKYYQGHAVVRLLDEDLYSGALLLELLEPGYSLKTLFPYHDGQATEIAASLIKQLHQKPLESSGGFPSLKQWFAPLFEKQYPELASEYDRVQEVVMELLTIDDELYLCHGDLHHDNILKSKRGWTCIDPKGVIAPLWFEVGCFMRNPLSLLEENAASIIDRRFAQFVELLSIEREVLVHSSYAQAVLAASWALDNGEASWKYFFDCSLLIKKEN